MFHDYPSGGTTNAAHAPLTYMPNTEAQASSALTDIPKSLDELDARLHNAVRRAAALADFLDGPRPEAISKAEQNPAPSDGFNGEVSRLIQRLFLVTQRLDEEMDRITRASHGA